MSPHAIAPGHRLVDRYRLDEALGEGAGTSVWRAHDEVLDRLVGVRLLSGAHSAATLEAARAAARFSDPRFLRVLDANEVDDLTYVVTEWVPATTLTDLVGHEPLRPDEAHHVAREVAEAVQAAHSAGLAHLCLVPDSVLRTSHGQVKVAGLAVDAAALGVTAPDASTAAARDARDCAAVLYAALTGRWPEPERAPTGVGLPAAPLENGHVCRPRQVRPHIPADLDRIASRGLGADGADKALTTPGALADALAASSATTRIPVVRDEPATGEPETGAGSAERGRPSRTARLGWALAALLLVVGVGLVGWQAVTALGDRGSGGGGNGAPSPSSSSRSAAIRVVAAKDFDPEGDGTENPDRVGRAIDGQLSTEWTTKTYKDPFGPSGLKDGVGLILDLGSVQQVSQVRVSLDGTGTSLDLRTASSEGSRLDDYTKVATVSDAGATATLRPSAPVSARYLLIWLTALPPADGGYRGGIAEVSVRS